MKYIPIMVFGAAVMLGLQAVWLHDGGLGWIAFVIGVISAYGAWVANGGVVWVFVDGQKSLPGAIDTQTVS